MWIVKQYDLVIAAESLLMACSSQGSANSIVDIFRRASTAANKFHKPQKVIVGKREFEVSSGLSYSWEFVPKAEDL